LQRIATFLDTTLRDVAYGVRGFTRAPMASATIVFTVGLGLGLVAAAFTLLNMLLFRVDYVPDVHEMYALDRPRSSGGGDDPFTRPQFDALRRETSVFADAFAQVADVNSRLDGRNVFGTFVTGNAFQVLRVHAARGRALTPADDEPGGERPVMVLSDRGWDRLFGRDAAVVGRSLLVNNVSFEIVGVMPDGFRGLASGPPDDYWAPLSTLGHVRPIGGGRDAAVPVEIIGRLKPGLSEQTARAGLAVWDARQSSGRTGDRSAARITLVPKRGTVQQPREAVLVTAPLFFSFGLILLIACANVANLLLARGVSRQREIGVRLSLGASRGRIARQLLTENLLLAVAAAAAGLGISRVVLASFVTAMMASFPPEIGDLRLMIPDADWRVLLFLVASAAAATAFFGLAPALHATRIEPLRAIRGEIVRDARPGRARSVLVGVQVSASALLLISAAIFLRSALTATIDDPGMRIADTVLIQIPNEAKRTAILQAVAGDPSIAAVAASWPGMASDAASAFAESAGAKTTVAGNLVSPEFFSVLDIAIVRGRPFMPAERSPDSAVAIVSETAARALWPRGDPVGQVLHLDPRQTPGTIPAGQPSLEARSFTVVGVARDVPGFRIAPFARAVVYVPASATMSGTGLVARVHGDSERAVQPLVDRLAAIDPGMSNRGQVGTMLWITRMETYFLQLGFWFTVLLGGLALLLTVSGLFGVLSYLVEQRTKEIGVRMALGATVGDVTRLVLSQVTRPVGAGLIIGGGASAALAALLLAAPDAAGIGQIVHVFDPAAYAMSVAIILAACLLAGSIPAARAARLDPVRTLRQD
jgi:predicted permease